MKRMLRCILCTFLFSTMCLSIFAEDIELDDSVKIPVSASVKPSYTVTIPTFVKLDESVEIKAENVLTEADKAVMVAISGTNQSDNAYAVSTEDGATIKYVVQKEDKTTVELHTPILFEEDGSEILSFVKVATNQIFAGNYRGTVTFTVTYDTITNERGGFDE